MVFPVGFVLDAAQRAYSPRQIIRLGPEADAVVANNINATNISFMDNSL
jgi:hypothetical protein